jgi:hypothetical protein
MVSFSDPRAIKDICTGPDACPKVRSCSVISIISIDMNISPISSPSRTHI